MGTVKRVTTLLLPAVLAPQVTFAMTFVQVLGIFHIFVGLFLVITLLTFGTGVFIYFARLGTWPTHRDTAIKVLEWAVAELFILILMLDIVQFFERHTAVALSILSFIIVATVAILIIRAASAKEKKKPAGPQRPGTPPRR